MAMSVVDHSAVDRGALSGADPGGPLIPDPRTLHLVAEPRNLVDAAEPVADLAVTAAVAAGLLDLLVETTTMAALLAGISALAVDIVPQCEAASVSMVRHGAPVMVASEDARARHVDEAQYRTGEGPYLHAAQTGRAVQIDDLAAGPGAPRNDGPVAGSGEPDWRRAAQAGGFTAVLAVPLASDGDVAAVITLYSGRGTAWSPQSVQAAEILADHAWSAIVIADTARTAAAPAVSA
jgi:GAF domain-containing protein